MTDIHEQIKELEAAMMAPDFWSDKEKAQETIRKLNDLKAEARGEDKYDALGAVVTIFAGAGGDDAEDFSCMLFEMYQKYAETKGWPARVVHSHENDHGGYRNVTFEIDHKNTYGTLKNESGVHRLVRISPFNAKKMRHTSFAMVEVVPKLPPLKETELDPADLDVQLARSSGPGGQNVNKRETAVRVVHTPTNIAAHAESERSQAQNKEKALAILAGKLHKKQEEDRKKEEQGLSVSKTTSIEWGSQIRSYVLHPYKMVKDHRTGVEVRDIDGVLSGDIQEFIDAEKDLK